MKKCEECGLDCNNMAINGRTIDFWSCEEDDQFLGADNICDAVINFVNEGFDDTEDGAELLVFGFSRTKVPMPYFNVLEGLIDYLDENFGSEEGERFAATDRMKKAEEDFMEVMKEEYDPESYEIIAEEIVVYKKEDYE